MQYRTFRELVAFTLGTISFSSSFPDSNDGKNCNDEILHVECKSVDFVCVNIFLTTGVRTAGGD